MPGNLAVAAPSGVLPKSLCTAFTETHVYPLLVEQYHDGSTERSLIFDGVNTPTEIRTWKLSKKLNDAAIAVLLAFFEGQEGGLIPFYFYDPYEPVPGQPIGSNWDPTGAAVEGRHTVIFRGDWSSVTNIGRSEASLELLEVA
jgi:hypothetical protein